MSREALPYSKRKRQLERAGQPVIYQYYDFPDAFKAQVFYGLQNAIGVYDAQQHRPSRANYTWTRIERSVREELGVLELTLNAYDPDDKWQIYVAMEPNPDLVLDAIEIAVRECLAMASTPNFGGLDILARIEVGIQQLNQRFREHGLGYEIAYASSMASIIKIDSQFIHAEIVEPAIASLHAAGFHGALDEFMKAHQEYRRGHHKDAATEAAKAFESTMKTICAVRGWTIKPTANASDLIRSLIANGLIPQSLESFLMGLPTLRNKLSAHGQGQAIVEMPDYYAAFALHLSASTIVFLMAANQSVP